MTLRRVSSGAERLERKRVPLHFEWLLCVGLAAGWIATLAPASLSDSLLVQPDDIFGSESGFPKPQT